MFSRTVASWSMVPSAVARRRYASANPSEHLARWRSEAGDPLEAVAELEQLLAEVLREWGADHPATLAVRNNLGRLRDEAGDHAGATAELEQLLADIERVLGRDQQDRACHSPNGLVSC
jgi:hypothetical protein